MTSVIIGDIHHKTRWIETFLNKLQTIVKIDEVIFTGDYFDDFNDNPTIAAGTAHWLKERIRNPRPWKEIYLVGNHDLPYYCEVLTEQYNCPGYDKYKDEAINNILTREDWNQLKGAYYTQGWLVSHAGFSYNLVAHPVTGVPSPEQLVEEANAGLLEASNGATNKYYLAGWRMAEPHEGGITWSDWNNEYIPITAIPQIVGHTPGSFIRAKRVTKERTDYCIDCGGAAVLIIKDGVLEVCRTGVSAVR